MLIERMIKENDKINALYQKPRAGYTIALLGNPNVGKSTVFNALTGMKQHTGNWPGKTVALANGYFVHRQLRHKMVDLPGIYSLLAHSGEEEVTRNFVCFEKCDICIVVCDSTCLERNMNLVLQTLEITKHVILVLNMMDEAIKKHIEVDIKKLKEYLHIEVVAMDARKRLGFDALKEAIATTGEIVHDDNRNIVKYGKKLEQSISILQDVIQCIALPSRFIALKLLDPSVDSTKFYECLQNKKEVMALCEKQVQVLQIAGIYEHYEEEIVQAIQHTAHILAKECIHYNNQRYQEHDIRMDRILTGKGWGTICMIVLLCVVFWITISGANVPSAVLSTMFAHLEAWLHLFFKQIHVSPVIASFVVDGVVKTCGWVIAVMLPPMAIFFPMFTILEDFGYLPRIAFNLDGYFQKAHTCGKQALTMCMGFGCNAVGVSGARIIDSPRERLIAIITNVFVPCNGRFPTLISILTMFFAGVLMAPWNGLLASLLLASIVLFGVFLTLVVSYFLSKTFLKGVPSFFTLELPPYRKPRFGNVIVRSLLDRTLFVLGRAVSVAIPAGAIIWVLANVQVDGVTLLSIISTFLDPFAHLMGLDGVILMAFILGFPANEIVVPIIIMAYLANGSMVDISNLTLLKELFVTNGWTWITAICTLLFSLVHFPCATTLLTIHKESGGWKWTLLSFLLPTILGIVLCIFVNGFAHLLLWLC